MNYPVEDVRVSLFSYNEGIAMCEDYITHKHCVKYPSYEEC